MSIDDVCFRCPLPDCDDTSPRCLVRQHLQAYQRAYREANREKAAAYQRAYYEANREKWKGYAATRRDRVAREPQADAPEARP